MNTTDKSAVVSDAVVDTFTNESLMYVHIMVRRRNGVIHCDKKEKGYTLPAVIKKPVDMHSNMSEEWWLNGKLDRTDVDEYGYYLPAVVVYSSPFGGYTTAKEYWVKGIKYSEPQKAL